MDYLAVAHTLSLHLRDFLADILPLVRQTVSVTALALHLHLRLLARLSRPLLFLFLHLYYAVTPLLFVLARNLYRLFTLQPAHVLAAEACTLLVAVALLLLERRLRLFARVRAAHTRANDALTRRYRRLRHHIRSKSRTAAALLPHLLFTAVALFVHSVAGSTLAPFTRGAGMVLLACVHPAVRTFLLLYRIEISDAPSMHPSHRYDRLAAASHTPASRSTFRPRLLFTPAPRDTRPTHPLHGDTDDEETPSEGSPRLYDPLPVEDLTPDSDRPDRHVDDGEDDDDDHNPFVTAADCTPTSPAARPVETTPLRRSRRRASAAATSAIAAASNARRASDARARASTVAAAIVAGSSPEAGGVGTVLPSTPSPTSMTVRRTSSSSSHRPPVSASSAALSRARTSAARVRATSPRPPQARVAEARVLRFWVVFGAVWAVRQVAWFFCPRVLEGLLAAADTRLFYLFVWAQLPMTRGADVVYEAGVAMVRRRWSWRSGRSAGLAGDSEGNAAKLSAGLRLLVALRVVDEGSATRVFDVVRESGLALIGVVFLILPRWATFVGTLLIGLGVPCYLTMVVLEAARPAADDVALARHNWLAYWGVFSLVDAGFAAAADGLGWVPLWYHAKMVCILWLQLPYYRGSVCVLDWFMARVGVALSSVRQQTVTPMKRKRA